MTLEIIRDLIETLLQREQTQIRQLFQELPDQGLLVFAIGNMIRCDHTQVDLPSNFFALCTNVKVYLYNYL